MQGLPHDAATWRDEPRWPWELELAAAQLEVTDMWGRIIAQAAQGGKFRKLPPPLRIPRPGEQHPQPKRVETDPVRISEWFRNHVRG